MRKATSPYAAIAPATSGQSSVSRSGGSAFADPAVTAIYTKAGTKVAYLDAPDFAKVVTDDHTRLAKVVKDIGKLE